MKIRKTPRPKPEKTATITAAELVSIVGLNERWLRKLATAGRFPPPILGVYERDAAFVGLLKYQRELLSTKSDDLRKEQTALTRARRERAEVELDKLRGTLVDVEEISTCIRNLLLNQRATLHRKFEQELANNLMGLTDVERRERIKSAMDEYMAIMYEGAKKWLESPPESE